MSYEAEAAQLAQSAKRIKDIIEEQGWGTMTVTTILGELLNAAQIASFFKDLPSDQRDEFFAQIFDEAIGSEPHALVNQVGFLEGEALEAVSDGIKAGALAYFNREIVVG
jgi:hypothetical protein